MIQVIWLVMIMDYGGPFDVSSVWDTEEAADIECHRLKPWHETCYVTEMEMNVPSIFH
jgi:hypothetical protein